MTVFDHCNRDMITVIGAAIDQARDLGHNYLGTEHLLVALAERRELLPEPVSALLPDADAVRSAIAVLIGGPPRRDAELLKTVGIDLEEVRSPVRRTFGDDAIGQVYRRRVHQPWQPWRCPSRRCTSLLAGTMSVAARVKQALERAKREADRRHRELIDPAGLLLGMVQVEDALSNRLLRDNGVDPERICGCLSTPTEQAPIAST